MNTEYALLYIHSKNYVEYSENLIKLKTFSNKKVIIFQLIALLPHCLQIPFCWHQVPKDQSQHIFSYDI